MLGWSFTVRHEGETVYDLQPPSQDLTLSKRVAEVADEIVDMSHLYAHIDPSYKVWWPGCGYPDVYKVRNDRLQEVMVGMPAPAKLRNLSVELMVDVELWDQS